MLCKEVRVRVFPALSTATASVVWAWNLRQTAGGDSLLRKIDRAMYATDVDRLAEPFHFTNPIDGKELIDRLQLSNLDALIPSNAGVYLWCRRTSPRPADVPSADAFFASLLKSIGRPVGIAKDSIRHLGHVELQLGTGKLGALKEQTLRDWLAARPNRESLRQIIRDVDYSYALYVGETDDLLVRIGAHLAGQTEFSHRLAQWGYAWSDLGLRYASLPETSVELRTSIERLLALMLIAPGVERSG